MSNPLPSKDELTPRVVLQMYADIDPDELGEDKFIGHHSLEKATQQIQQLINDEVIRELESFQESIVSSDKYRSDVDQQAWAYARVHRLAQDRIKELKKPFIQTHTGFETTLKTLQSEDSK